jgi:hypothetical protein
MAKDLHKLVGQILEGHAPEANLSLAESLEKEGYHLRITKDFETAKDYLRQRYKKSPEARYGIIASSKDKDLVRFGIANDFRSTKRVNFGPWYGDVEDAPGGYSCRNFRDCITEFGAQGLEMDAALVAWGTDLMMRNGKWTNAEARGYMRGAHVKNPFQLRLNAYRVLLTRGRDVTLVYVPPLDKLNETYEYLSRSGFKKI